MRRITGSLPGRVFLFGSRASGSARAASDIDIGLLAKEPLPPALLADLRKAFEESRIPYTVDVVDLPSVDETFRTKVMAEAQTWDV